MLDQIFKPLNFTSGLFQTIPIMTGDQKIVVDTNTNKINFSNLTAIGGTDNQMTYIYDFNKAYSANLAGFKSKLVDANRDFYYDQNILDDKSISLLDKSDYESYRMQWYNRYQWGVHTIDNKRKTFRFFAPIWLTNESPLPKYFVILRKQKTIDLTAHPNSIRDILLNGELVQVIDLNKCRVYELMEQIITDAQFTNTPIAYSNDKIVTYGINVDTGKYEDIPTFTDNDSFWDDNTITLDNQVITNLFRQNNQVCCNILNVDFEFSVPDLSGTILNQFDYFGIYCGVELETMLEDFNLSKLLTTIYYDQNLLSITELYNNQYKLTKHLFESDFGAVVPTLQLNSNSYDTVISDVTRQIHLKFNGIPLIGDYISIETDYQTILLYASNQNAANQFKVESTISDTIDNIIQQFKLLIDTIDTYDFEFHKISDNRIVIDSNIYFDSVKLKLHAPSLSVTNVLNSTGQFAGGDVDFPTSAKTENTIVIKSWQDNPSLTSNPEILFGSTTANLQHKDGTINTLDVLSISQVDSDLFIKFSDMIFTDSDFTKPMIVLKQLRFSRSMIMSYFPISHIDKTLFNPTESRVYDFDIEKWFAEISVLQSNGYGSITLPELNQIGLEFLNVELDALYIKSLQPQDSETSNNPYDRLIEKDLQSHAFINKQSNSAIKWCHAWGTNANGYPHIANRNIAFSLDSGLASQESFYDSYQNLDKSWFVIGTKPRDYVTQNYDYLQSYATKLVDNIYDFHDVNTDKFIEYLKHSFNVTVDTTNFVDSFCEIRSRSTNLLTDMNGFAMFRGVEYLFDSELIGYKFSVVLMNFATVETDIEFIVNDEFKTCILLIKYAIADTATTNLNSVTNTEYSLDRIILYNQATIDNSITSVVTSKYYHKFSYPNLLDTLTYSFLNYSSGIIDTGSMLLYAIRFKDMPTNFLSGLSVNDDVIVYTTSQYGVHHEIQLIDVVEVNVADEYVWFKQIIVTDIDTSTVLLDTDIDTEFSSLTLAQSDGIAKFQNAATQEQYYYINHSVTANSSATRFDQLRLVNCIDKINDSTDRMQISERDTTLAISRLTYEESGISNILAEEDFQMTINLLRQTVLSVPLVQYLFWPKQYSRSIGVNDYVLQNCAVSESFYIPEYIIKKIGDSSTLTTDNRNDELPQHWAIGETVLASIKNDTSVSIDNDSNIRIYLDRNSNQQFSTARFLTNYTSLISTIIDVNLIKFDTPITIVNGNYDFNLYTKVFDYLALLTPYNQLSKLELNVLVFTILTTYNYKVTIFDTNGQAFVAETQQVNAFNSSTTIDKYQISGYVSSNKTSLTATIEII